MAAKTSRTIPLPQFRAHARRGGCGSPKPSARGKWRALSLVLVHVIVIAHILHWKLTGSTMTPLEPSESIQTVDLGLVNAGFILFVTAILATLIFGRFFCGWACHLIAYQDACTWLLNKLGLRPKPFRSRLLIFVPLLAALYMFIWPLAHRFGFGIGWPRFEAHFVTDDFWRTFPNLWVSIATFIVCGGLIVYLLGNKGFCTYACPYGGFFAPADTFAPGKIRVTDACEGCGHCSAACGSNVRVHEEVRLYGMVVDPGCMKCMDCISVCPKEALYFGFGRPAVAKPAPRAQAPVRRFDYSWPEELWLAALFLLTFYAFRGLYNAIPLLFALGLSAICAFLLLRAGQILYKPNTRLHGLQLRSAGTITLGGGLYLLLATLLLGLIAHSSFVQFQVHEGGLYSERSQAAQRAAGGRETDEVRQLAVQAAAHYESATRSALLTWPDAEIRLGSLRLFLGDFTAAEQHLRRAIAVHPNRADALHKLAETLARQKRDAEALELLLAALRAYPEQSEAPTDLLNLTLRMGKPQAAVDALNEVLRRRPKHTEAVHALAAAHFAIGQQLAAAEQLDAAAVELRRAVELRPQLLPAWLYLGHVHFARGDAAAAAAAFGQARLIEPLNPQCLGPWAVALRESGGLAAAIEMLRRAAADDLNAQYALVFLLAAQGDQAAARTQFERVKAVRPDLPPP